MAITLNGSTGITSPGGDTSTSLSTGLLTVTGSTVPANGMYLPTTNTLAWATNSTERLRLDASGNLGLGVTPSSWGSTFKAVELGTIGNFLTGYIGAARTELGTNAYYNGSAWTYANTAAATRFTQISGEHRWYNAPSGTAGAAISFTQAMTLDASGNLGIGTTSTSGYGNFANALQSATVSANSTAKSWDSTYRVAAVNASAVDAWLCRDAAGAVAGNNTITGYFYINVIGASGSNGFSAVYSLVTTGNGTLQATLALVSSVTRGTSPVSTVTIANDGVNGAIKLQITYINNSGVVTGGYSNVVFKGLII